MTKCLKRHKKEDNMNELQEEIVSYIIVLLKSQTRNPELLIAATELLKLVDKLNEA